MSRRSNHLSSASVSTRMLSMFTEQYKLNSRHLSLGFQNTVTYNSNSCFYMLSKAVFCIVDHDPKHMGRHKCELIRFIGNWTELILCCCRYYALSTSTGILEILVLVILLALSFLDLSANALIMSPSGIKSPIEPQEWRMVAARVDSSERLWRNFVTVSPPFEKAHLTSVDAALHIH